MQERPATNAKNGETNREASSTADATNKKRLVIAALGLILFVIAVVFAILIPLVFMNNEPDGVKEPGQVSYNDCITDGVHTMHSLFTLFEN
jgi:flagellar basal body-associated protein FliL